MMKFFSSLLGAGLGLTMTVCTSVVHAESAAPIGGPAAVSARVDGVLHSADQIRALPEQVMCRAQALSAGGSWLLVSRSWGGSPNLRHRQLVAMTPGQPQPSGRVPVAWRDCAKQA